MCRFNLLAVTGDRYSTLATQAAALQLRLAQNATASTDEADNQELLRLEDEMKILSDRRERQKGRHLDLNDVKC